MKAIKTTYLGPTNLRGARIKATEPDGRSATLSYPYELNPEQAHQAAAAKLIKLLGWSVGDIYTGALRDSYVHVFGAEPWRVKE